MFEHEVISSIVGEPANRASDDSVQVELRIEYAALCGVVGGALASAVGRERTRVDNAMVAGLFTAFAAYRDPRKKFEHTLAIAAAEGLIWGLLDRAVPFIKSRIFE